MEDPELRERLLRAGARFEPERASPFSFGDPAREAAVALSGCIVADRSSLGRLRMLGKDRQDLLHRLSTNEINALKPGEGNLTVLLNSKGRVLDLVHALAGETDLLLVTSAENGEKIRAWIDTYIFREEVSLEETGGGCLGLYGAGAASTLARLGGGDWEGLPLAHHRAFRLGGALLQVARTFPLGGSGFLLLGDRGGLAPIWDGLTAAGAVPAGDGALERLRVAAGVPQLGRELTEDYNPWELALDRAISLTKGCYLGQEVVARLNTYRKVQRLLAGLSLGGEVPPGAGSPVFSGEEEEVGRITSAAISPTPGEVRALALLQTEKLRAGEDLEVVSGNERRPARVVALPFCAASP